MNHVYQLPTSVSHQNVESVLLAVEKILNQLSSGDTLTINCRELIVFDSSALSVVLSIKRRAEKAAVIVKLTEVPEKLASLAEVYDLADIVLS
jgi:phospholipid transport system transporter-binding protein